MEILCRAKECEATITRISQHFEQMVKDLKEKEKPL